MKLFRGKGESWSFELHIRELLNVPSSVQLAKLTLLKDKRSATTGLVRAQQATGSVASIAASLESRSGSLRSTGLKLVVRQSLTLPATMFPVSGSSRGVYHPKIFELQLTVPVNDREPEGPFKPIGHATIDVAPYCSPDLPRRAVPTTLQMRTYTSSGVEVLSPLSLTVEATKVADSSALGTPQGTTPRSSFISAASSVASHLMPGRLSATSPPAPPQATGPPSGSQPSQPTGAATAQSRAGSSRASAESLAAPSVGGGGGVGEGGPKAQPAGSLSTASGPRIAPTEEIQPSASTVPPLPTVQATSLQAAVEEAGAPGPSGAGTGLPPQREKAGRAARGQRSSRVRASRGSSLEGETGEGTDVGGTSAGAAAVETAGEQPGAQGKGKAQDSEPGSMEGAGPSSPTAAAPPVKAKRAPSRRKERERTEYPTQAPSTEDLPLLPVQATLVSPLEIRANALQAAGAAAGSRRRMEPPPTALETSLTPIDTGVTQGTSNDRGILSSARSGSGAASNPFLEEEAGRPSSSASRSREQDARFATLQRPGDPAALAKSLSLSPHTQTVAEPPQEPPPLTVPPPEPPGSTPTPTPALPPKPIKASGLAQAQQQQEEVQGKGTGGSGFPGLLSFRSSRGSPPGSPAPSASSEATPTSTTGQGSAGATTTTTAPSKPIAVASSKGGKGGSKAESTAVESGVTITEKSALREVAEPPSPAYTTYFTPSEQHLPVSTGGTVQEVDLRGHVRELQATLEAERQAAAALQEQIRELRELEPRVNDLVEQKDDLLRRVRDLEEHKASLRGRLREAEREVNAAQEALRGEVKARAALSEQHESAVQELHDTALHLRSQEELIAGLRRELQRMGEESQKVVSEQEALLHVVEEMEGDYTRLRGEAEGWRGEREAFEARQAELTEKVAALESSLLQSLEEGRRLQALLDQEKGRGVESQREKDRALEEASQAAKSLATLQEENAGLKGLVEEAGAREEAARAERAQLEGLKRELEDALREAQQGFEGVEQEVRFFAEERRRLEERMERTDAKLREVELHFGEEVQRSAALAAQLQQAEGGLKEALDTAEGLAADLEAKEGEVRELRGRLEVLEGLEAQVGRLQEVEGAHVAAQGALARASEELEELRDQIKLQDRTYLAVLHELEELQDKFALQGARMQELEGRAQRGEGRVRELEGAVEEHMYRRREEEWSEERGEAEARERGLAEKVASLESLLTQEQARAASLLQDLQFARADLTAAKQLHQTQLLELQLQRAQSPPPTPPSQGPTPALRTMTAGGTAVTLDPITGKKTVQRAPLQRSSPAATAVLSRENSRSSIVSMELERESMTGAGSGTVGQAQMAVGELKARLKHSRDREALLEAELEEMQRRHDHEVTDLKLQLHSLSREVAQLQDEARQAQLELRQAQQRARKAEDRGTELDSKEGSRHGAAIPGPETGVGGGEGEARGRSRGGEGEEAPRAQMSRSYTPNHIHFDQDAWDELRITWEQLDEAEHRVGALEEHNRHLAHTVTKLTQELSALRAAHALMGAPTSAVSLSGATTGGHGASVSTSPKPQPGSTGGFKFPLAAESEPAAPQNQAQRRVRFTDSAEFEESPVPELAQEANEEPIEQGEEGSAEPRLGVQGSEFAGPLPRTPTSTPEDRYGPSHSLLDDSTQTDPGLFLSPEPTPHGTAYASFLPTEPAAGQSESVATMAALVKENAELKERLEALLAALEASPLPVSEGGLYGYGPTGRGGAAAAELTRTGASPGLLVLSESGTGSGSGSPSPPRAPNFPPSSLDQDAALQDTTAPFVDVSLSRTPSESALALGQGLQLQGQGQGLFESEAEPGDIRSASAPLLSGSAAPAAAAGPQGMVELQLQSELTATAVQLERDLRAVEEEREGLRASLRNLQAELEGAKRDLGARADEARRAEEDRSRAMELQSRMTSQLQVLMEAQERLLAELEETRRQVVSLEEARQEEMAGAEEAIRRATQMASMAVFRAPSSVLKLDLPQAGGSEEWEERVGKGAGRGEGGTGTRTGADLPASPSTRDTYAYLEPASLSTGEEVASSATGGRGGSRAGSPETERAILQASLRDLTAQLASVLEAQGKSEVEIEALKAEVARSKAREKELEGLLDQSIEQSIRTVTVLRGNSAAGKGAAATAAPGSAVPRPAAGGLLGMFSSGGMGGGGGAGGAGLGGGARSFRGGSMG